LPELDPAKTAHDSRCQWCRANVPVLLADSRLEAHPWRLTWRCRLCGKVARAKVHDDALPVLLALDRAGGMPLSVREVERFVQASTGELEAAVLDELL
jgi:RNase P subunit RPR2